MSNNIHLITTSSAASASSSSSASTSKANQPTTITIQPQQPSSSASGSNMMRKSVFLSKDGQRGTSQVPVRIVQALPSNAEGGQVRKIIQLVKNDKGVPSTSYIKIPLTSPIKAAGKKMLEIPHRSKIVTNTKMKVAESIKIQKTTSVAGHNSTSFPSNAYTTPTKLVTVSASPSLVRKEAAAQQQQSSTSTSPTNSFSSGSSMAVQNHLASPIRPKPSSSFLTSPPRNKRPAALDHCQATESKRRRTPTHGEKGGKGLRHFAMLVCEKVKQKVTTTYNEVADELVTDYAERQKYQQPDQQYDQKNIRRRVYDALNVLMAMNIIFKDKKDIHWVGLPTNSAQEVQALQSEKTRQEQRIQMKKTQLQELILQQIAFKNLVERNKRIQETQGAPPENSSIQLPFIIVNTSKKTVIDCSISNDKFEYLFNFNNTFEIHDDIEVLKRMGMAFGLDSGACTSDNLKKALNLVPDALKPYVEEMAGHTPQQGASFSAVKSSQVQATSSLPGFRQIITKQEPMSDDFIQQQQPSTANNQADSLFRTIKPDPDPNDQEVAMVTTQLNNSPAEPTASSSSSSMVVTSSASSGMSSRPHSAGMMSITPLSSSRSSAAEVGFDDDEEEDGETSVSSYNNQQPLVDSFVS